MRQAVREGPARRDQVDLPGAGLGEHCSAGRCRGTGGEDIVHQEDPLGRRPTGDGREGTRHRPRSLLPRPTRLRSGRGGPADEGDRGEVELAGERLREHARLVEPALGPPPAGERHPRHHVCRRRSERRDGGRECFPHPTPSRELQPVDRVAGRSPIRERGTRRDDRRRRTVATGIDVRGRRPAAATAPRRLEGDEGGLASLAERPRARAASGTGPWEQDVDRPIEHLPAHRRHATARRRHAQGSETSSGSASLTEILTTDWVFSTGYATADPAPDSVSNAVSNTGNRAPSAASVNEASAPP
jgi:hypothetical protein